MIVDHNCYTIARNNLHVKCQCFILRFSFSWLSRKEAPASSRSDLEWLDAWQPPSWIYSKPDPQALWSCFGLFSSSSNS